MIRIFYIAAFFALLTGCVHDSRVMQSADLATIGVYVRGEVNNQGYHTLVHPFTIEHAIQQAGGIGQAEYYQNNNVQVWHKDRTGISGITVMRADYSSFILADGDNVAVPRH